MNYSPRGKSNVERTVEKGMTKKYFNGNGT